MDKLTNYWYWVVGLLFLAFIADTIYFFWGIHEYFIFGDNPYPWYTCIWKTCIVCFFAGIIAYALWICMLGAAAAGAALAAAHAGRAIYQGVKELFVEIKNYVVSLLSIRSIAKEKCPAALRAEILRKKNNAVDVGIYNSKNSMTEKITINADMGFSDDVKTGETIVLVA